MSVFKTLPDPNPRGLLGSDEGVIIDLRYSRGLISYKADGILYEIPVGDICRYKGKRGTPIDINKAYRREAYGQRLPDNLLARMRVDLVAAYAAVGKGCVFPWG